MSAATARRPVRVTIDGEAYSPADGVLIVVRKDGGKIVFPAKTEGVTVEDTPPARVWTDGDVVQGMGGIVYSRSAGRWYGVSDGRAYGPHNDAATSAAVANGHTTVLRYQHGGDQ